MNCYRVTFEATFGEVSDRRWKSLLGELKHAKIQLNIENVRAFAQLKLRFPKSKLTSGFLEQFQEFSVRFSDKKLSGKQVLKLIKKYKPTASYRYCLKFFYKNQLNYGAESLYDFDEFSRIIFSVLMTKNREIRKQKWTAN